jgi:hypothetical protein
MGVILMGAGIPFVFPTPTTPFAWAQTDKDVHFTNIIAVNNFESEQIANLVNNLEIRSIVIESSQQLEFELWFWRNQIGINNADPDIDSFLGLVDLDLVTHGRRLAAAGLYRLDVELIAPILLNTNDTVTPSSLNMSLVNRGPGQKNAAPGSTVVIKYGFTAIV